ncbi:MAG: mannose-1-phosphate guanylyltransferase [Proteobacteria bacterium]|nr:mannose-1-phosphate guanylyltransferase [Pseudomonadota bacterium]
MEHVYAVIMAGGVGSRFWPASRARTPKQLLDLTGSGRTMIAATVDRLTPDIPPERVIVVTGEITAGAVVDALPEVPKENILAEPEGRNTAPCIGWAAIHVKRRDSEGVLAVLPSDHLVAHKDKFLGSVRVAVEAALEGGLITFGIMPDRPETGFGYIEMGEEILPGVLEVKRFVEKPDLSTAKKYVAAGNFTWNSGMFFFTADRFLDEIARQMPDLKAGLDEIEKAIGRGDEVETVRRVYPNLPSQSVDYGIMEGADTIRCVPVDFGWSDLGSWAAAYDQSEQDENNNSIGADGICVEASGCLVRAPNDKLVALVGVEDLIIVDTGDSLLVCRRDRAQSVKDVVKTLKHRGLKKLL